jgi:hypothetical protein
VGGDQGRLRRDTVATVGHVGIDTGQGGNHLQFPVGVLVSAAGAVVHHNLAEIQDIREEASLIFRMEDGEGIGLLNQAA